LRGTTQPELSKKLYKLIKSENHLIQSHEAAAKERLSIASQLSDWGEATNDDAVSDVSDKVCLTAQQKLPAQLTIGL
jgi:hypothetical protein